MDVRHSNRDSDDGRSTRPVLGLAAEWKIIHRTRIGKARPVVNRVPFLSRTGEADIPPMPLLDEPPPLDWLAEDWVWRGTL